MSVLSPARLDALSRASSHVMDFAKELLQTALRLVPWPTATGLRVVGHPDESSPVVLTTNYDLTVRRLLRALRGSDAWVVVAPASGINVWCAAAGGHFSTHQVVTALKTSGVAERVKHRDVILPQLAATGVEGLQVFRRARWRVRFGPVRAVDIPRYLAAGCEKDDAMRRVDFSVRDRLEMAAAWAAPASLLISGVLLFARSAWALPVALLVWGIAVAEFLFFERLPEPKRWVLGAAAAAASSFAVSLAGGGGAAIVAAVLAPFLLTILLTLDYAGSTPTTGSGTFEGQDWKIQLDSEACQGLWKCWEVCPEACFEKREEVGKVEVAHADRCIRCGACVVQCPQDALFFEDGHGRRIAPETIRRFKLNLLGKRTIQIDAAPIGD